MKMLSDLLIGHNWPIIGRFCQINQKKSTGLYPNVLYSFHGYQKNRIDPNTSEKKSLAQSNIRISSNRCFRISAHGKQAENYYTINFRLLWPRLHLKKA